MLAALAALQPRDHICLIYSTTKEQLAAVVPYMRIGLERGERCVYIVDENTAETVVAAIQSAGVDTAAVLSSGALVLLTKQDTYLKAGIFDPERMIALLTAETQAAKKLGYSALRVTGEMTWALGDAPGADRLIEYEAKLNDFFPHHDCLAICQYNRTRFSSETIRDVILTHPVVVNGGCVYRNIYYLPPALLLGSERTAHEVDRLLNGLAEQQALLDERQQRAETSESRFQSLFDSMTEGVALHEMVYIDGRPADYRIIDVNPAYAHLTGVAAGELRGRLAGEVHGGEAPYLAVYAEVAGGGEPRTFETYNEPLQRHFRISVASPQSGAFATIIEDITEPTRTEQALRASEEKFAKAFHSSPDAVLMSRVSDGRIVEVNDGFTKLTGFARDEALGSSTIALKLWADPSDREVCIAGLQSNGSVSDLDFGFRVKSGEIRRGLYAGALISVDGEPHVLSVVRDITERRQAEEALRESEDRFKYVFDHSVMGMSITLVTGEVTVNDAFCAMLGYSPEELADVKWQDISHPDDLEATQRIIQRLQSGEAESARFVKRYLHKDGSVVWADVGTALRRNADSTPRHFLTTVLDITERQKAQDEIARLNAELEQRVLDRTAELRSVNKELEAFSYSISHDLRAPLRHVSGFVELLRDDPGTHLDDSGRRYLTRIQAGVTQMGRLIDDLLQFSRAGRTELRLGTVAMDRVMHEALAAVLRDRPERAIEWTVARLPDARGDEAVMRVVWANLLDNAVKFSERRACAHIEIGARESGGEVEYWVRDDGAGFDMKYADKLFGMFQRLHSARDFPGTGIGLANVQRLVTRLGGRVWAEGATDAGATFHFSLPR